RDFHVLSRASGPSCNQLRKSSRLVPIPSGIFRSHGWRLQRPKIALTRAGRTAVRLRPAGHTSMLRAVQLVQEDPVRSFDVQSVEIHAPFELVFEYLADSGNLPEWTHAFASVDGRRATMCTPVGMAEVELAVSASKASGTIDWDMVFANGEVAHAWSR